MATIELDTELLSPIAAPAGAAPRPLNVVIVDEELPCPPTSGKRIRTLNLTRRLARRHRITYLCHRNPDASELRDACDYLNDHGITAAVVEQTIPAKRGIGFYARLGANLLSPLPYSVASHNSRAIRQALRAYAAEYPVDLWHCEWTPYAAPLRAVSGPRLVMAHNVESLIWQRYGETETNPLKRWYIRGQWRKFERFERRAFAEADSAVAVSAEDARLMAERFGVPAVEVVDNGVDTSYYQPAATNPIMPQILFLGSLDWRPNLDAVRLLLDEVFPAVRRELPVARLCLVGRRPPLWLRARAADQDGVALHADPPDVRPFLAQSSVLAVPLRIGGGSRLKILEALACAVPVVATRIGAEGLSLRDEEHLTVVPEPANMAAALIRCLRQPDEAKAQAARGRRVVLERYDWDVLADRLEQIWIGLARKCVPGYDCRPTNAQEGRPQAEPSADGGFHTSAIASIREL